MATGKVGLSGAGLCKGKQSWPELVDTVGEAAEPIIKAQNPYVKNVIVVQEGTRVTDDFRCDRVWVWIKPDGFISKTPTVG